MAPKQDGGTCFIAITGYRPATREERNRCNAEFAPRLAGRTGGWTLRLFGGAGYTINPPTAKPGWVQLGGYSGGSVIPLIVTDAPKWGKSGIPRS